MTSIKLMCFSEFPSLVRSTIIYPVAGANISEVFLDPSISLTPVNPIRHLAVLILPPKYLPNLPFLSSHTTTISIQHRPSWDPCAASWLVSVLPLALSVHPPSNHQNHSFKSWIWPGWSCSAVLSGFIALRTKIRNVIWPPRLYGPEPAQLSHPVSSRASSVHCVS